GSRQLQEGGGLSIRRRTRGARGRCGSTLLPHQAAALAFPRALLQRFALVVQLLAARKRDLDFRAALLVEVELERDDGHAFALYRANEAADLPCMQQQFPRALRRMIERSSLLVFGDIGI